MAEGARQRLACDEAGISERTYQRWKRGGEVHSDQRPYAVRPEPANKLDEHERERILATCNEPEHASLPPGQIVPKLADQGIYMASEASFYRVLHDAEQLHHRGRARAPQEPAPAPTHTAHGPNEVWSWDITYLPSLTRGWFYYLYLLEDVFSRKAVGWEVHESESGAYAAALIERAVVRERCVHRPLVLHSDNGAPMTSYTLSAKLGALGVTRSHGRPGVSNDNAFSEALFRTLKYRPHWPAKGFASLAEARVWVEQFIRWYNHEHRHSGIQYVTPAQRHAGEDEAVLEHRRQVYEQARQANPLRWSKGIRDWKRTETVSLNPTREAETGKGKQAA